MIRDENLQTGMNSAINYDRLLSPIVLEAIQNDAQIKALNQRMNDLYMVRNKIKIILLF